MITLIHGTWAQDAPWTQSPSLLRRVLEKELRATGATSVIFSCFPWSGGNKHEDRRRAAISLYRYLRNQTKLWPFAKHFIVAHSHAGNVALRALRKSDVLKSRIGGLITIATPFLMFEKQSLYLVMFPIVMREFSKYMLALPFVFLNFFVDEYAKFIREYPLAAIFVIFPYLLCAVVFVYLYFQSYGTEVPRSILFTIMAFASAGILFCVIELLRVAREWAIEEWREKLERKRQTVLQDFAYLQPSHSFSPVRLLVLTSPIDEAYEALTGSWWLHRLSVWLGRGLIGLVFVMAVASVLPLIYGVFSWLSYDHFVFQFFGRGLNLSHVVAILALAVLVFLVGAFATLCVRFCRSYRSRA